MHKTVLAALALMCTTASAQAQNLSANDLARRTLERHAVEAITVAAGMVKPIVGPGS